jgi:DNA-binding NtrC family response regulator
MPKREFRFVRSPETNSPDQTIPQVVPLGAPPQAMRVVRDGQATVVLPLETEREYELGRSEKADIYFSDPSVSRRHGLLYFSEAACAWVFKDLNASFGTRLSLDGKEHPLLGGSPVGLVAGHRLQLGKAGSRIEFLAEVPLEVAAAPEGWKSEAALKLEQRVRSASGHALPVAFLGPSGAGKTFIAREIHQRSRFAKAPFVAINCGTLPSDRPALHSVLLGHVKGAYTGAAEARLGLLFHAHGGTLFLDEVEYLVREAQAFLVTVLEGNEPLLPLGAQPSKAVARPEFRIISASKKRLEESGLRHDLVTRLAREVVRVPSLSERREDIPVLVQRFIQKLEAEHGATFMIPAEAMRELSGREWPGEIRELWTTIEVVANRKLAEAAQANLDTRNFVLSADDFGRYLADRDEVLGGRDNKVSPSASSREPVARIRKPADLTRDEVEAVLREAKGNKTQAARLLGVAFNTFQKVLSKHGL